MCGFTLSAFRGRLLIHDFAYPSHPHSKNNTTNTDKFMAKAKSVTYIIILSKNRGDIPTIVLVDLLFMTFRIIHNFFDHLL